MFHPTEYLIEAALLGAFMLVACCVVGVVEHPGSPVRRRMARPGMRRAMIGLSMGATAVVLIYSPWGRQSGAHMNPATTLAFLFLGKVSGVDAGMYIAAQFAGATLGMAVARAVLPRVVAHPAVNFVMTSPGRRGVAAAWGAEFGSSFVLMLVVLGMSVDTAVRGYTGYGAGLVVALAIVVTGPVSGMSINPARTFASALYSRRWRFYWIYGTAPVLGMLAAAAVFAGVAGMATPCAKMHHDDGPCIFGCVEHRGAR